MNKFEDIMDFGSNYTNFKLLSELVTLDNVCNLVPYIGTGLSFYYKSWGEPFKDVIDIMNEFVHHINPNFYDEFNKLLEDDNPDYLSIGDQLSQYCNDDGQGDFNTIFTKAICQKQNDEDHKNIPTQYNGEIPTDAIYLIPYIKANTVITTNCDDSLQKVYLEHKDDDMCAFMETCKTSYYDRINNNQNKKIHYLHGHYTNKESLVMTRTDYDEAYSSGNVMFNNQAYLCEIAEHGNMLFLGVGLQIDEKGNFSDLAIEMIKECLKIKKNPARHIALFSRSDSQFGANNDDLIKNKRRRLLDNSIQCIFTIDFSDYSIILLEALREARSEYWNQDYMRCNSPASDSLRKFICSKKMYEYYCVKSEDPEQFIKESLKEYLYGETMSNRTSDWRICRVNSNEFCFYDESTKFSIENYHLPVGNTIYIIGGNNMYNDKVTKIISDIHDWTSCNNKNNRFLNDRKKKFGSKIKIRVIEIKSELSPLEKAKKEREEIEKKCEEYKNELAKQNNPTNNSLQETSDIIERTLQIYDVLLSINNRIKKELIKEMESSNKQNFSKLRLIEAIIELLGEYFKRAGHFSNQRDLVIIKKKSRYENNDSLNNNI